MRYTIKEALARTVLPAIRRYKNAFGHYPYLMFPHQELPDPLEVALGTMRNYFGIYGIYPNVLFPKTFNEKVQVRKIFDRRPFHTDWADKYAVRTYVARTIGPQVLPSLLHVTCDPDDIPFERLPETYVVKASHGSSWLRIVQDSNVVEKGELVAQCKAWLSRNAFYTDYEWQYNTIKPRILVEEFLDAGNGKAPNDYKFFVFDGSAQFIQVDIDRHTNHKRTIYDAHWNRTDCRLGNFDSAGNVARPEKLDLMIDYAQRLSNNVDFVRVDLYEVRGKVYFGEMTSTPGGGTGKFSPRSWDRVFGDFWKVRTH